MNKQPKILAFAGSLRKNSYNKRVLQSAVKGAKNAGAKVTVIDLEDYEMPIYNADLQESEGFPPNAVQLQKLLLKHDGLLIASPEYNGSLPAALKNALDWASRANGKIKTGECFKGKHAVILTASPGSFGGLRCLGHLRDILTILQVQTLPQEIAVSKVHEMFDGNDAKIKDEKMRGMLENSGSLLVESLKKHLNNSDESETK